MRLGVSRCAARSRTWRFETPSSSTRSIRIPKPPTSFCSSTLINISPIGRCARCGGTHWSSASPKRCLFTTSEISHSISFPASTSRCPRSDSISGRHRAFAYYHVKTETNDLADHEPDLLFSFQGRHVAGIRDEVLRLTHPRALVEETSSYDFFRDSAESLSDARSRYREMVGRSKFVLCPRGAGTSTFRLFEALAAGRVPVIVSDEWVAPEGVEWSRVSVRVRENDVAAIPRVLEALEADWPIMSRGARAAYLERFSLDVWFHNLVEHCRSIQMNGPHGRRPRFWLQSALWRLGARNGRSLLGGASARR